MIAAQVATLATFAVVWSALAVGHNLADHVLGQTDRQAAGKSGPGAAGWGACLAHVGLYHVVLAGLMGVAWWALPLHLTWPGLAAGFGWSAVTHALLDRRWPVRWILERTGSGPFSRLASGGGERHVPGRPSPARHGAVLVGAADHQAVTRPPTIGR